MLVNIIVWVIVGGLAGWLASKIMNTDKEMGIGANVVVGIVGAIIGGFLMQFLFNTNVDEFSLGGFVVAVLGAVILLGLLKMVSGRK
jgi:uncharacterized membrane protein YeaQ/YmgE (transglycosylase-associated protein family)